VSTVDPLASHKAREELQRFLFWACVLPGACGRTYGADGVILINTREQPFGFHPHGFTQGDTPWQAADLLLGRPPGAPLAGPGVHAV
jgi:hypothetical protein